MDVKAENRGFSISMLGKCLIYKWKISKTCGKCMVFVIIISILHRKIEAFTEFKHLSMEDVPSHVGPRVSPVRDLCV